MPTETVCFVGGRIRTMDGAGTVAEAFRAEDGRITAIGTTGEILAAAGDARVVDLAGAVVLPGLVDCHSHLELLAYSWELAADCRSSRVSSVEGIVAVLADRAAATPAGEWVLGQGEHYQNLKLAEGRYPDRHDLDRVSTVHPVMYRASYHINVFNSLGLDLLGVDDDTPDAPGGRIERDPDTGVATGRTYDMFEPLGGPQPSVGDLAAAIRRVQDRYLAVGVTTVGDIPLHRAGLEAIAALAADGGLVLRAAVYPKLEAVVSAEDVRTGRTRQHIDALDPDHLRMAGFKVFLDGGLTAGAAALHADYPGQPGYRGELAFTDREVADLIATADDAGLQIAMHAIGDRALDQALDGALALPTGRHGVARHRIEHAGNMFMTDERIKRLAASGVVPVPQPAFIMTTAAGYVAHLGTDRIGTVMPFRTLIDHGLPIPGNSDAIGITEDQHDPFPAMRAAVTRRTNDGDVLAAGEAVSVEEALRMYTEWAAFSIGWEDRLGSLEVGKFADFVVLSADPLETGPEGLAALTVGQTWIGATLVYERS
ncbi:amidohydrolase [Micromonospora cathayae]|uniref:Amidohydrolase n=1 Tax=Micromonospora cathayae TaxID=3028804 RepID=A0ABY7ZLM6_9ACTN|nr:amidohydrolase [Micromonospora sp. HUAS 3]WDZ83860.1 amidohydrolase [Micromonospora sp. HUAS 3]